MKKLFILITLLILSITCFPQTYPVSNRANASYTVQDARLSAQYNLFVPKYADTTAANLQLGNDSLSAIIFTYNTMSLWVRAGSPKTWVEVGVGGGGGSGTLTNLTWTTSQGVSAVITNPTTTPNITVSLGALTGVTSLNGLVVTPNTGTITTGIWNGTAIGSIYGGTGQTTVAVGDLLVGTGVNTWGKLTAGTATWVLTANGAGVAPSWQELPSDNLLFDSLGNAGISPMTTWNNTLYARRISVSGGSIDTTASGGLLITVTGGGGSGLFPTTGTGTATGNVIGDLDGNILSVQQGEAIFLYIDPTLDAELVAFQSVNPANNDSWVSLTTDATNAGFEVRARFNLVDEIAIISGAVASGVSTIAYTADTHTFNGAVTFADLAGNGAGFAAIDNNGTISWSAGGGGGGDVTKVGTPVNHEWGVWTGDGTLKGVAVTASRAVVSDANGDPIAATTTATEIGYVNGVTSAIQTQLDSKIFALPIISGSTAGLTDGQSIYFISNIVAPSTSATNTTLIMDRACTLIGVNLNTRCTTTGTGEAWSMYVRVNNTTDYLIATVSVAGNRREWVNTAMNTTGITLSPGDEIIIKSVNPTWATEPATMVFWGYMTFKQ